MSKTDQSSEKKGALAQAVFSGDQKEVHNLISLGINPKMPLDELNSQNGLHISANSGHYELVEYFLKLDNGPDINARDAQGFTAFLCAASFCYVKICWLLIQKGADPKIYNAQNTTPLHYLARKNPFAEKRGTTLRALQKSNETSKSYLDLLDHLLAIGIDINLKNYRGETALMQAANKGNIDAVVFLLDRKANPAVENTAGETAVFYASSGNWPEAAKLIQDAIDKHKKKDLIVHRDVKLDNYVAVIELMQSPESGVQIKDRTNFFIQHRCFLGSELVDWILKYLPIRTREEAVIYIQQLMDAHWIVRTNKKKVFKDKRIMCLFSTGEAPPVEEKSLETSVDDFEQVKMLGKGAFGKVLQVRKRDTGKVYAMKIMEKDKILTKPRDFKNLMGEKRILQNDCPFLVHLYYAFQTEVDFYFVMDFIGGGDLYYHLKQKRTFSEKAVQFITAELLLALAYLHSRGIIYRDLKPHNVLLEPDGNICLADFGLSKEASSVTILQSHTACGTPSYSALEVLLGKPYGKGIDYWALGILMYQFLVGKTPFAFGGSFQTLIKNIQDEKGIVWPREQVSRNAQSLIMGFLEKDPEKRLDDPDLAKRHPFFKGIEWDKLEVKKMPSPIKMLMREEGDNFDPKYTNMPVKDKESKQPTRQLPHIEDFTTANFIF